MQSPFREALKFPTPSIEAASTKTEDEKQDL